MTNDVQARETMIDTQVRPNDVTDRRIHTALMATPREAFLPRSRHALANAEVEHETATGRFMWRARDFAKLVQALDLKAGETVLDIAPGTGYSSAILAHLCAAVVGLEADEQLATGASERLDALNIDNADVVAGNLEAGLPAQGPYDAVFVNGAVERVPDAWIAQLKDGGRLAVIVREGRASHARLYTRTGDTHAYRLVFDAAPPALPGFEAEKAFEF